MKPNKLSKIEFLKIAAFVVVMLVLVACQTGSATETQNLPVKPTAMPPSQTVEPTVVPTEMQATPTEDSEQTVKDIQAWLKQVDEKTLQSGRYSQWSQLVDKEVLNGKYYNAEMCPVLEFKNYTVPYAGIIARAYVADGAVKAVVDEDSWLAHYGTHTDMLAVAFEGVDGSVAVPIGIYTADGKYLRLIKGIADRPGVDFSQPGAGVKALVGKQVAFRVVAQSGDNMKWFDKKWEELLGNKDSSDEFGRNYRVLFGDMTEVEIAQYRKVIADQETLPAVMSQYLNGGGYKTIPERLNKNSYGVERLLWVAKEMGVDSANILINADAVYVDSDNGKIYTDTQ